MLEHRKSFGLPCPARDGKYTLVATLRLALPVRCVAIMLVSFFVHAFVLRCYNYIKTAAYKTTVWIVVSFGAVVAFIARVKNKYLTHAGVPTSLRFLAVRERVLPQHKIFCCSTSRTRMGTRQNVLVHQIC